MEKISKIKVEGLEVELMYVDQYNFNSTKAYVAETGRFIGEYRCMPETLMSPSSASHRELVKAVNNYKMWHC